MPCQLILSVATIHATTHFATMDVRKSGLMLPHMALKISLAREAGTAHVTKCTRLVSAAPIGSRSLERHGRGVWHVEDQFRYPLTHSGSVDNMASLNIEVVERSVIPEGAVATDRHESIIAARANVFIRPMVRSARSNSIASRLAQRTLIEGGDESAWITGQAVGRVIKVTRVWGFAKVENITAGRMSRVHSRKDVSISTVIGVTVKGMAEMLTVAVRQDRG